MSSRIVQIGLLTAMASVLFALECMIPLPMPWMRIGLANVITLLALRRWGIKEGMLITVARVLIGGLISGRFMQPLFFMALAGGISSAGVMWLMLKLQKQFSLIGVSIIGACTKNAVQLAIAGLLLVRQMSVMAILPFFLLSSLVSGFIIGYLAVTLDRRIGPLLNR